MISKEDEHFIGYTKDKGIHILNSEIIYQLLDKYKTYQKECLKDRQDNQIAGGNAVYPCKIKILKQY